MKTSLSEQFNIRKYGFFYLATLGYAVGTLLPWSYTLITVPGWLTPMHFLYLLASVVLYSAVFIAALYLAHNDWVFIPLLGIGYATISIALYSWAKGMFKMSEEATILRTAISDFVAGILFALILVLAVRLAGIKLHAFLIGFVSSYVVLSLVSSLIWGRFNFGPHMLVGIISDGLQGALLFWGISMHRKKGTIV